MGSVQGAGRHLPHMTGGGGSGEFPHQAQQHSSTSHFVESVFKKAHWPLTQAAPPGCSARVESPSDLIGC